MGGQVDRVDDRSSPSKYSTSRMDSSTLWPSRVWLWRARVVDTAVSPYQGYGYTGLCRSISHLFSEARGYHSVGNNGDMALSS